MNDELMTNKIKILKGNIKKYRVEVLLIKNSIKDILINIDFLQDNNNKTYILSLSDEQVTDKFLNLFQFLLLKLDTNQNNMKLQEFLLNFQKLFEDLDKITKEKNIDGSIVFEFSYDDLPNNYTFNGTINKTKRVFISSEINYNYFLNMNDNLFIEKEL